MSYRNQIEDWLHALGAALAVAAWAILFACAVAACTIITHG